MTQPWTASVEYSLADVARILREQTSLEVRSVSALGEGWDNSVFLVNEELVFRAVRREQGLEFARNEAIALPLLPSALPLAIPRVSHWGQAHGKWPWMLYPLMRGLPGHEAQLTDQQRIDAAPVIGAFLRRLHAEDISRYESAGLAGDWCGHMNLEKRLPLTRERLKLLREKGIIPERPEHARLIEMASGLRTDTERVLAHGDFKATHVFFENGVPRSVIDWGDIHIGHPATDLAVAFTLFPSAGRRLFREAYGIVREETWILARFRALFHTLTILDYALATEQTLMAAEARRALAWSFEDPL